MAEMTAIHCPDQGARVAGERCYSERASSALKCIAYVVRQWRWFLRPNLLAAVARGCRALLPPRRCCLANARGNTTTPRQKLPPAIKAHLPGMRDATVAAFSFLPRPPELKAARQQHSERRASMRRRQVSIEAAAAVWRRDETSSLPSVVARSTPNVAHPAPVLFACGAVLWGV